MATSICRNSRCGDPVEGSWALFCPACELAIAIGFKYGAVLAGVFAAIAGFVVARWAL